MTIYPLNNFVDFVPYFKDRTFERFSAWFKGPWRNCYIVSFSKSEGRLITNHSSNVVVFNFSINDLMSNLSEYNHFEDAAVGIFTDIPMNNSADEFQFNSLLAYLEKARGIYLFDTTDQKVYDALECYWRKFHSLKKQYADEHIPLTCFFFDGEENLRLAAGARWAVIDFQGQINFADPSSEYPDKMPVISGGSRKLPLSTQELKFPVLNKTLFRR